MYSIGILVDLDWVKPSVSFSHYRTLEKVRTLVSQELKESD